MDCGTYALKRPLWALKDPIRLKIKLKDIREFVFFYLNINKIKFTNIFYPYLPSLIKICLNVLELWAEKNPNLNSDEILSKIQLFSSIYHVLSRYLFKFRFFIPFLKMEDLFSFSRACYEFKTIMVELTRRSNETNAYDFLI